MVCAPASIGSRDPGINISRIDRPRQIGVQRCVKGLGVGRVALSFRFCCTKGIP